MRLAVGLRARVERGEVWVEGDLRVDDDDLAAGKAHEHVRAQRPALALERALLEEVAVRDHARHLDRVAKLDLAPGAARRGTSQCRHEVAGLVAQRAHAHAEVADYLRELALGFAALALEAADLALHP